MCRLPVGDGGAIRYYGDMSWLGFNATVTVVLCCAALVGVAYGVSSGVYPFAAWMGLVAIVMGAAAGLRIFLLLRNRSIRAGKLIRER